LLKRKDIGNRPGKRLPKTEFEPFFAFQAWEMAGDICILPPEMNTPGP
jgi:hypothetical protein